jgi:hypothetical protein
VNPVRCPFFVLALPDAGDSRLHLFLIMIEYKIRQLVRKIKDPDWDPDETKPYKVPVGFIGEVVKLSDISMNSKGQPVEGILVSFPTLGTVVCQRGTMIPITSGDDSKDTYTKISWDDCIWKPKPEYLDSFDLDFQKQKTV